jgi:hypothetical protein
MATGTYSGIRASDININDLDVFYTFTSTRELQATQVFRLNPTDVLTELSLPEDEQVDLEQNLLEGMYNLKLPANIFNSTGVYTIYIRPKVLRLTIVDCGVLSALPTVKGIIIDGNELDDFDASLLANNALQGYRIEYINSDGTKLRNTVRYVVSSNKVVPVTENVGNTSQTAIRYRFDDNGTLLFLQVTPSSASSVKPNVTPFIGNPDQTILMSNTNVNPLAIEVEFVENTLDTLVSMVAGEQIKDVDNGILTLYDENRNILRQFDLYEIKEDIESTSQYEVKQRRTNLDLTQDFDDITSEVS